MLFFSDYSFFFNRFLKSIYHILTTHNEYGQVTQILMKQD